MKNHDILQGETKPRNHCPLLLQHPYRMCITGESGSGKTKWLMDLLLHKKTPFDRVLWVAPKYSLEQTKMQNLKRAKKKKLVLFDDIANEEPINKAISEGHNRGMQQVVVFDDLMSSENKFMQDLFTSGRHKNCSIIEICQRIFTGKNRTHRLNTNYFVIFNFGDQLELKMLARQLYPNHHDKVLEAYNDATAKPYGCLIIDQKCKTMEDPNRLLLRLRDTELDQVYEADK